MRATKLPVSLIVGFCLFALAAFSGGAVLFIGYGIALQNTRELMYDNANLSIAALRQGVDSHLEPVAAALDDVAAVLARNPRLRTDSAALEAVLRAAAAGLPQITALVVVDRYNRVFLSSHDRTERRAAWSDWSEDVQFRDTVAAANRTAMGHWGAPYYAAASRLSLLNYYLPLTANTGDLVALAAVISLEQLSDRMILLSERPLQAARLRPFILYGRDSVLAHPLFLAGYPGLSRDQPLPRLADFTDPVLSQLWTPLPASAEPIDSSLLKDADGRVFDAAGRRYAALYTTLSGYGPEDLLLGTYVDTAEISVQLDRLAILPQMAAGLLVVILVLALIIGRLVARPARQLAAAADYVRRLELDAMPRVEDTVVRELSAAAGAFNAMTGALRLFAAYVPHQLVRRLMRLGSRAGAEGNLRRVTVMFTDITGFTTLSETLSAGAIAGLLNEHFTILGSAVEAEGGTIDKYIGDALMAFWGAPDEQPDAAERACRAAQAIATAVSADNRRRRAAGQPAIGLRIGIHSGPAVVGDIGFPGRINYTIVGDTVNACQRLESLARDYGDGRDVTVLLSGETAATLGSAFALTPCGRNTVKGRDAPIEVFRLEPAP